MAIAQLLRHFVLVATTCLHCLLAISKTAAAFTVLPSPSMHTLHEIVSGQSMPAFNDCSFYDDSKSKNDRFGLLLMTCTDDHGNNNDTVLDMLCRMTHYFSEMVDVSTNRFYAISRPPTGEKIHVHCPLRDMGVAWDATTLLLFWRDNQQHYLQLEKQFLLHECERRLHSAVMRTLEEYAEAVLTYEGGTVAMSSDVLREPANIAHSGFFVLLATGALKLSCLPNNNTNEATVRQVVPLIDVLTRGILSMQRPDGAFGIEFSGGCDNIYKGIEYYPGEAMVALMEVHQLANGREEEMSGLLEKSTQFAILPSLLRAFDFYSDYYRQGNVDTNYNIWQVQAFSKFFHAYYNNDKDLDDTSRHKIAMVADYVLELCRDIAASQSWRIMARGRSFYPNLQTVEIACGLDAVVEGVRVALALTRDNDVRLLWPHVTNAVDFLKFVQDQVPPNAAAGCGGLGYGGIQVFEQRLDVSGHAISALTKVHRLDRDYRL